MLLRLFLLATVSLFLTGTASADDEVNNPEYASWAKFPKGTSITRVSTSVEPSGRTSVVTETITLLDVEKDKVVVEVEYISDVPGSTKFKTRPKSREILKTTVVFPEAYQERRFHDKAAVRSRKGRRWKN